MIDVSELFYTFMIGNLPNLLKLWIAGFKLQENNWVVNNLYLKRYMCHESSSSRAYEAWNSQKHNVIVKNGLYVITISRIWCVHIANKVFSNIE